MESFFNSREIKACISLLILPVMFIFPIKKILSVLPRTSVLQVVVYFTALKGHETQKSLSYLSM